jgi:short-subunit dehydrogenase
VSVQLKAIEEQVIVITGASSGIGLATAREAAKRGARLVLAARSEATLAGIVEQLRAQGADAVFVPADVGNRAQLQQVADVAIAKYGRVDTWVNDAGVSIYGRLDEVSDEDSHKLFETNFWGVVYGSLIALPLLKKNGGALINIGSEASEAAIPPQGMYSASKHAVKGFTDALRVEIEEIDKAPVSITLIQPTAVDTPYPQHAANYTDKEPKLPTPQIEAEKVAHAILHAATHQERDVKVGGMAVLNTMAEKLVPGLADKMAAKQNERQNYDEPPRNPGGALHSPGGTGQTKGSGPSTQR